MQLTGFDITHWLGVHYYCCIKLVFTLSWYQMGLAQSIQVEFLYLPSYSPKLNLVEYVIHLLRLRFLHHLPTGTTLAQIEQQLNQFFDSNQFLSAEQVQKTLNFIFSVVT